jgi:riboflavin biosynthesis pyrimidine reductase
VPPANANAHDVILFKQLLAQAHALITTSAHLRAVAKGMEKDLLNMDSHEDSDLIRWRKKAGLTDKPALIVLSQNLDLPHREALPYDGQPLYLATWNPGACKTRHQLEQKGYQLLMGRDENISASELVETLGELDFTSIYATAGPFIFSKLLREDILDRLYLTITQQMLGGELFDTLTAGQFFRDPVNFTLRTLYLDTALPKNVGQLFAVFDKA